MGYCLYFGCWKRAESPSPQKNFYNSKKLIKLNVCVCVIYHLGSDLHVLVGQELGWMFFQVLVVLFLDKVSVPRHQQNRRNPNKQE
jgi:hypothetical protein